MTDLRLDRVVAPWYFTYRFFRREPKNRLSGATFHLQTCRIGFQSLLHESLGDGGGRRDGA